MVGTFLVVEMLHIMLAGNGCLRALISDPSYELDAANSAEHYYSFSSIKFDNIISFDSNAIDISSSSSGL